MNTRPMNDIQAIQAILHNIDRYGLKRFDPQDTKFHRTLLSLSEKSTFGKYLRLGVLTADEISPFLLRRIMHCEKSIMPTTYTFLASAYLQIEKENIPVDKNESSIDIMQKCIKHYLTDDSSDCFWDLPIEPYMPVVPGQESKRKTMHLHGLARINILLLRLWREYKDAHYLDIAHRSLLTTVRQHNIVRYKDGTQSISYFPYSDDCTLNICSEFAQWLSMLPGDMRTDELNELLSGLVRLLVCEQRADGAWEYVGKQAERGTHETSIIDCHHTGTVLTNLMEVVSEQALSNDLQGKAIEAIERGINYYIRSFFDMNSGNAITEIGKKRTAGPVQFGEATISFCTYLRSKFFANGQNRQVISKLLPKIHERLIQFISEKDGSCPSGKVLVWQNINSIRWGNGVVLQALTEYNSIKGLI